MNGVCTSDFAVLELKALFERKSKNRQPFEPTNFFFLGLTQQGFYCAVWTPHKGETPLFCVLTKQFCVSPILWKNESKILLK
jgi:hypothetical protein